jgi:DNA-binding beta-propeller fold protein YncE
MKSNRMVFLGVVVTALVATGAAFAATVTPVMTNLDNPRGLAFGKDGALYVAEAGRGGASPCQVLRPGDLGGAPSCYGPTGRISRYWKGRQEAVVTGLPSYATASGADATGPHDLAVQGKHAFVTIGWGENPALRATPPGAVWGQFGHLVRAELKGKGKWKLGADISAYEAAANPAGGPIDTNPYGILQRHGRLLVTDAGGNDLLQVRKKHISTVAVFPSRSTTPPHSSCAFTGFPAVTDSVPTAVTVGPDGAYYVGELTGAPFCAGFANVYRVVPGQSPTVYCGGFTTIIDLAFGPDKKLYVAEHSNGPVFFGIPGDVVRVGPACAKTVVTPPLNRPGSLAFGRDGKLYVSVNSNSTGSGQVVRID